MESNAQWIRRNIRVDPDISDNTLNEAGNKPEESVYSPIGSIDRIVIHHSATATGSARVFRALHRAVNGWVDIGYHYVIGNGSLCGDGEVEPGRPPWAEGAHSRNHNHRSLGICLVGDLNESPPTQAQMVSLGRLLRVVLEDLKLSRTDIRLHRGMPGNETECPGRYLTLDSVLKTIT